MVKYIEKQVKPGLMRTALLFFVVTFLVTTPSFGQPPADFVNPFIGTSNYGATHPGANYPHAMVSVTPFNVAFHKDSLNRFEKDSEWHSRPYVYENKYLTGFSHVNLSGVGCPDLGSIILMPTSGELAFNAAKYGSEYSEEMAKPGYYSNYLNRYDVKAEVTSTRRTGLSRFTFPAGKANILLNLGLGLTNETGASIRLVSPTEVEGFKTIGTFCYHPEDVRPVYFVMKLSHAATRHGVWKKMPEYQGAEANWVQYNNAFKPYDSYYHPMAGEEIGAYFQYESIEEQTVEVKIGISYVSIDNARANLEAEQSGFDFEQTRQKNYEAWNDLLGRISIKSDDSDAKTIFYTGVYHTLLHPNIINDVNGDYPLMGQYGVGNTRRNRYSVFSLWDTYRNVHPFLSLVYPELQSDMVNTMVDMYKESGWLPKWELAGMETGVMVGDPASPVIADTYLRGIKDFDVMSAYEAMKKASDTPEKENTLRPGIDRYNTLGYVAEDTSNHWDGGVSTSLEYYISDWNLSQLAKALGKKDDYQRYLGKSMGYKNLLDPVTGMLRPRFADGAWLTPFNPEAGKNFEPVIGYVEGNAWQYRFYVPHDISGLIRLLGGQRKFNQQLDLLFSTDNYDMANEPDITYPYLYNYVKGQEWKSQRKVRELIEKHYHNHPAGIPGNDDTGALSTWLTFSMLGIYPTCPGDMDYAIVSPYFDEVVIELNKKYYPGGQLTIKANRPQSGAIYIDKITFDGQKVHSSFIDHSKLVKGGVLEFTLIEKPKTE